MAAFSNVARYLTLGLLGGTTMKKAGVSAPNPVATAIADAKAGTPPGTTPTAMSGPTPPDAQAARSSAMTAAQRAAQRQRKRATAPTQTLATGLGVAASTAPRTLLGY